MKKFISLVGLEILFLVFISSKLGESVNKSSKISIKDFPMTVGSQWTYLRSDTLIRSMGRRDPIYVTELETVTVQVIKRENRKKKEIVSEWVRKFNAKVDTQYVILRKDTVEFTTSTSPAGSPFNFKIPFPLKVGSRWYGQYVEPPPPDSYKVVQLESLELTAGTFTDAYLIERGTWIPNNPANFKYWVVPKIGIVKIRSWDLFTLGGETKIENWELIKYEIKE